jgi:hypothetical protein
VHVVYILYSSLSNIRLYEKKIVFFYTSTVVVIRDEVKDLQKATNLWKLQHKIQLF